MLSIKLKSILKIILVNVLVLFVLVVIGSLALRSYFYWVDYNDTEKLDLSIKDFNTNTIRATYPVYDDMDLESAIKVFKDYAGPISTYYPFLGWRRNSYVGETVNIDKILRTRISINHKIDDSIWFFGGSTMWGTGSDDNNTIPSHFASLTGENVLNLGESSFLSFQEYIQLSMLLAKGLKPKKVIFYDGVNDSYYCNTNNTQFPTHSRVGKWTSYISGYPRIKAKYKKLLKKQKSNELTDSIRNNIRNLYVYVTSPYDEVYQQFFSKKVIGNTRVSKNNKFNTDTKMSMYIQKNKYKNCDVSKDKLKKASSTTVNTWLMVHDLLSAIGVEFKVFLQPTSQISRNSLNLDYLIDKKKQLIADEEKSYKAQYEAVKKEWYLKCGSHKACDSFHDISGVFNNLNENIYIDAVHVGPRGNEIVAKAMQKTIMSH